MDFFYCGNCPILVVAVLEAAAAAAAASVVVVVGKFYLYTLSIHLHALQSSRIFKTLIT